MFEWDGAISLISLLSDDRASGFLANQHDNGSFSACTALTEVTRQQNSSTALLPGAENIHDGSGQSQSRLHGSVAEPYESNNFTI